MARFDLEVVKGPVITNMPTQMALMGVDYLDYKNKKAKHYGELTQETKEFVSWLERELGIRTAFVGIGPTDNELIDRLEERKNEQARTREGIIKTISMS